MTICNIANIRDSVINEVERTGAEHAVFDLYGTLVDIHTDEEEKNFWKKLAKFLRRHGVHYEHKELKREYMRLCRKYSSLLQNRYPDNKIEINISDVFYELCTLKTAGLPENSLMRSAIFSGQSRERTLRYMMAYMICWRSLTGRE